LSKFVDYDPERGMAMYEDMTVDNKLQVHYRQDVEPVLELAKAERINGAADRSVNGKRAEFRLYARIPEVVILEMRFKHGVDLFNRDHEKKVFELINREYPHLKCTDMYHEGTKH
jgi:hypothetical protein